MNRFITILLVSLLLVGSLSAPLSAWAANVPTDEKIELTYWTTNNRKDWTEAAVAEFQKKYPNITVTPTFDLTDALKKNLKVGASSGTLPSMWYNYGGMGFGYYVNNGLSYNMNDYASENGWHDAMDPGLLALCTTNGELGGYPQVLTIFGAIYRKDIFEKYDIQVPTTFEEFEATLQTLKDNGVIPFAIGGKTGWHVIRFIDMLVEQYAGAEMHDKMIALEESWDQECVVKAFAKLKEWSDKGYFPEGFITSDPNDARLMLYNGLAAITLDGAPIIQMIQNNGADINEFGSFRIPNNETPDRMMTYPTLIQFNAKLSDAELEAAVAFVEFTLSEEPAFADQRAFPLPTAGLEFPESTPIIVPLQQEYEQLGGFTTGDHAFDPVITNAFYQAQESVIGGVMTPEQAAQFMQENIEAYKAAS